MGRSDKSAVLRRGFGVSSGPSGGVRRSWGDAAGARPTAVASEPDHRARRRREEQGGGGRCPGSEGRAGVAEPGLPGSWRRLVVADRSRWSAVAWGGGAVWLREAMGEIGAGARAAQLVEPGAGRRGSRAGVRCGDRGGPPGRPPANDARLCRAGRRLRIATASRYRAFARAVVADFGCSRRFLLGREALGRVPLARVSAARFAGSVRSGPAHGAPHDAAGLGGARPAVRFGATPRSGRPPGRARRERGPPLEALGSGW